MSAAHVAAVVARIAGTGPTALRVYDSKPSSPAYPYVVVYADGGTKSSDREADERITHTQGWQTTVIGESVEQCRAALDRTHDRLENWRPTVTGWTCSKVEHPTTQVIADDQSLPDRVLYYATDQWSYVASPT